MRVLVTYASRHGATVGIADRIATGLRTAGLPVDLLPVNDVRHIARYDAFVIGSAVYTYHWLKEATTFATRHRTVLTNRPVWLFSSGPLGTSPTDAQGRDILEAAVPEEYTQLQTLLQPRGTRVFFGAWDANTPAIGLRERWLSLRAKAKAAIPSGDFRDWPTIDA